MQTIHYVNLTNGLEAIEKLKEFRTIRIQSTACEQKRWDFIIQDLDNDFLFNLAIGNLCIVYDYGANKKVSRALYQGIPFIKYCLEKYWLKEIQTVPIVRDNNCSAYFNDMYKILDKRTFKKLDYFIKFLNTTVINLKIISASTKHDGDINFYKNLLIKQTV
jgi:hypothetical protein